MESIKTIQQPREAETHRLVGGVLCLDFANTINGHIRKSPHEYLHDYQDLILWSRHAGILTEKEAVALLSQASVHAARANAVFRSGLEQRELIFRIFSSLADGRQPVTSDLDRMSVIWQEAQGHARLVPAAVGYTLGWDDEPSLESPLRKISTSTIELLASAELLRVRMCASEGCDWLFVDNSRNHKRRWCSMDECGNRAKMRRRYYRRQSEGV
jgi:predicted RNA-binding Zn ribbon-like protein